MKIEYKSGRYHGFYRGFHLVNDSLPQLISTMFRMVSYKKVFIDSFAQSRVNGSIIGLPKHCEFGEVALSINK